MMMMMMIGYFCAILDNGLFLRMIQADVLEVFLDPGLNGKPYLSNVHPSTPPRDALYVRCFHAEVIRYGPKETGDTLGVEAHSFDVCLYSAVLLWLKFGPTKDKKVTYVGPCVSAFSLRDGLRESTVDLACYCSRPA